MKRTALPANAQRGLGGGAGAGGSLSALTGSAQRSLSGAAGAARITGTNTKASALRRSGRKPPPKRRPPSSRRCPPNLRRSWALAVRTRPSKRQLTRPQRPSPLFRAFRRTVAAQPRVAPTPSRGSPACPARLQLRAGPRLRCNLTDPIAQLLRSSFGIAQGGWRRW